VHGLNVATGQARWRCDIPKPDNYQLVAALSYAANAEDPPLVVSHDAQSKNTLVQRAWLMNAHGGYQAPGKKPIALAKFLDPDLFRPLPWSRVPWTRTSPFGLINLSLFLVFAGKLLHWSRQGKWRRALFYVLFCCVISLGIGSLMIKNLGSPLEADERYSWEGWYWILFLGGVGAGQLTLIWAFGSWLVRRLRRLVWKVKPAS
jgi:hypothetical protein